jgi:hypothetical protein
MHRASARFPLAPIALLLVLAAPAGASGNLKLKDGTVLSGRATAYDDQRKELAFRTDDGREQTFKLDQLDQRSVYMLNNGQVPKDSGEGQLHLANFARDIGLYAHAGRHYDDALKADPSLKPEIDKQRAVARSLAADYCLKTAQAAIAKNNFTEAERYLNVMVQKLPDEPQTEQARAILDQRYAAEHNARDDQLELQHAELLQGDLKKGKGLYDRMIARTKDGLMKEIDRLEKKYADDPKIQDGAAKYRKLTTDQMIELHLHIATNYTISTSYNEALRQANAALALDPNNANALAQRARIEQAATEGL